MNENALYEAKLVEIDDNLKDLKDIDIATKELESQVKRIKEKTKEEIKDCYQENSDSVFCNDMINQIYRNATQDLDRINNTIIRKYEEFYIIINTYRELNNINITKDNIESIKNSTKALLRKILQTTENIENYNEILDKIYEFAYKVVKYELMFNKKSEVLNVLKEYPASISPITRLIKKDINNLSKEKQNELEKELGNINKKGFNDIYYLNSNLISFLINNDMESKKDLKKLEESINDTYLKYEELQKQKEDSEKEVVLKIEKIRDSKKRKNAIWRKRIGQKALFALNIAGVLGASVLAFNLVDKIPETKHYKTTYTVYDSSNPEEVDETITYKGEKNNKLEITEYSPWENPGYFRNKYKRNVYKYSFKGNKPYSKNVEDYLNEAFKEYIDTSRINSSVEKSKEKPLEDYKENKYIIKQTYQDRTNFKYEENKLGKILALIGSILGIGVIDLIISIIYREHREDTKAGLLEVKEVLVEEKRLLLEEKNNLNTFNWDLENAKKRFLEQYEVLPRSLKEDEELQKRIKKITPEYFEK